ncbi:uncharacterized protein LOC128387448 [Panonychus citri]|uniref:uncharacterized protein LOC128387448 n=1 Tax=Panonychus citri TaxID=50023 RepID=UPI00230718FB|nr:uncharacterized protein LOC128387448 [Panonychus citri]
MIFLILLLAIPAELHGADEKSFDINKLWSFFKNEFQKTYYSDREERFRMNIFASNLGTINAHNDRAEKGLESFTMGVNKFSDLTFDEFSSKYLGGRFRSKGFSSWFLGGPINHLADPSESLPDFLDWRESGIVSSVKNQGACGSCWSFSTVSSLESAYMKKTGNKTTLSEQNLMDCSWAEGNLGCNGGWMSDAYRTVTRLGGIMSAADYPYAGRDSISCKYTQSKAVLGVENYATVDGLANMKSAVAKTNVAVAMEVDNKFQHYKNGVFKSSGCKNTPKSLNHAVNLVGFGKAVIPVNTTRDGESTEVDYWLLRNSWSNSWGESGYARIQTGQCGIEFVGFYPIIKLI